MTKRFSRAFFLCLLFLASPVLADSSLKTVKHLGELFDVLASRQLPALVLFTTDDCAYCEALRKNYLLPMMRSGEYDKKIVFRQLYMGEYNLLRDQKGELIGGDQIALHYGVEVSPTIVFLDAQGKEVGKRIIGVSGADYFDKTLSQHISDACKQAGSCQ